MSVNMKQNGSLTKIASLTKAIIPMGLAECYSTEEKEVGCWTDGKPLYQKTVYIANVTSGTSYAHGAENVENIFIKNIKAKRNVGWFSSGHIFQDGTGYISESFSIIPSPTVLFAYLYGNTISDCSVTIQYTKTTDTAGSGIWTPSGAQAVHYSTAEQVIGTYLGKTLYRKVINFSSPIVCNPQQWATTEVPTSSLNVETLVNSVCAYDGVNYPCAVSCDTNDTYISILSVRTVALSVKTLIVEYTKTTD